MLFPIRRLASNGNQLRVRSDKWKKTGTGKLELRVGVSPEVCFLFVCLPFLVQMELKTLCMACCNRCFLQCQTERNTGTTSQIVKTALHTLTPSYICQGRLVYTLFYAQLVELSLNFTGFVESQAWRTLVMYETSVQF